MLPEEEMTLFAALQDIADELRRIKRKRQEGSQERATQSTTDGLTSRNLHSTDFFYGDQEIRRTSHDQQSIQR